MNRRSLILSATGLSLLGFGGAAWYVNQPTTPSSTETRFHTNNTPIAELPAALMRSHSPILGPENAPVTIVEFLDPACEACRAFHPIVKDIMKEHGNAVRLVIRYTPFHGEGSEVAIRVLEAARMQGIFLPVLDALFKEQPRWAAHGRMRPDLIMTVAANAGLNEEEARLQMSAPQTVGILNQDRADVKAMGVRQTPTFFVNGKSLDPFGAKQLRQLVAAEVATTRN